MPSLPQGHHIQVGVDADPARVPGSSLYQQAAAVIFMVFHMEPITGCQGRHLVQHLRAVLSKRICVIPFFRDTGNGHQPVQVFYKCFFILLNPLINSLH